MTIITADVGADGIEVTGIVPGQTDPEAVCTLSASRDGQTSTAQATANPSGANSYCPLLVIPHDELPTGEWDVLLEYSSPAGVSGRSNVVRVDVP